jgi:hypothetical protein
MSTTPIDLSAGMVPNTASAGIDLSAGMVPNTPSNSYDTATNAAMNGKWESPSDISTGGEGSNSDQQLMSEASQREATRGGLAAGAGAALAIPALAAGPLIAAGTAGPALVDAAGEPIVQATRTMLQKFGENYPELTKLASRLGFHAAATAAGTGTTVAAWELLKHITGNR